MPQLRLSSPCYADASVCNPCNAYTALSSPCLYRTPYAMPSPCHPVNAVPCLCDASRFYAMPTPIHAHPFCASPVRNVTGHNHLRFTFTITNPFTSVHYFASAPHLRTVLRLHCACQSSRNVAITLLRDAVTSCCCACPSHCPAILSPALPLHVTTAPLLIPSLPCLAFLAFTAHYLS